MKKQLLCALLLFCFSWGLAQDFEWSWAQSLGSDQGMNDAMMCVDNDGNVYASASYFGAEVTFGSATVQNANSASEDIFLVKYNPSGEVIWAKGFGSSGTDRFLHSVCDSEGNLVVSGCSNSASLTLGSFTVNVIGGYDSFIAKIDPDGNVLWVKSFGGGSNDFITVFDLDENDRIFSAGYFYSPSLTLGSIIVTNTGAPDAFLSMLNTDGTVEWAFGITGSMGTSENPYDVAVSKEGQCLLSGSYSSAINIGAFSLTHAGGADAFLTLVDEEGEVQWAQSLQTASYESITDLEFVDEQSFYCTGWFESNTFTIGSQSLVNTGLDGSDVFLARFQINGEPQWVSQVGGFDNENTPSIAVEGEECFLTMIFESSMLSIGAYEFTNAAERDIVFARISGDGVVLWAESVGGNANDFIGSTGIDMSGNLYVAGTYSSEVLSFGENVLINDTEFGNLMYVAKLSAVPTLVSVDQSPFQPTLYPNPCDDFVNVNLGGESGTMITCHIYSSDGRLLQADVFPRVQTISELNTSTLPSGYYLLEVISGSGHIRMPLLKE